MTEAILAPIEFEPFPKISRYNRAVVITEKIDGTNAAVVVREDGFVYAQSRKRIITPEDDNFGFARWVSENEADLREQLGVGRHFGEWWGSGIQRGYNLPKGEKRFSLFNTNRWTGDLLSEYQCVEAPLCRVVPILAVAESLGDRSVVDGVLDLLRTSGSVAAPSFMKPEGVVLYHAASNNPFKITLEKDEAPKGLS